MLTRDHLRQVERQVRSLIVDESPVGTTDEWTDLLLDGLPNHEFGRPRPATWAEAAGKESAQTSAERGLREWLDEVCLSRTGENAAVWDTRMANPRILDTVDHSSRTIAKLLRKAGARLVAEAEHLYSAEGKGALVEGERDRARAWGTRHSGLTPVAQG